MCGSCCKAIGSQPMSTVEISFRLSGQLPSAQQLRELLGYEPTKSLRQGEQVSQRRVQPVDLWILELAKFDSEDSQQAIEHQLVQAASVIERSACAIATLDRKVNYTHLPLTLSGLVVVSEKIAAIFSV